AWLAGEGAGLYQGECRTDIADQPARLRRMLPYRGMRINLPSLTAVLMIQADPVDAIERHGGAALRDVHLAAGAVAQDFCLAAASHGMFARPVRMMREADLESNLPLQGQVVYQVLCGFARRSNLTMGLL
ncbi:nitroreductase family protein, partial [Zemynaea arenosa]|uniref:nitroreductase family protein n=1 Tax=Zemynaea arenosa TaxID=2561931 RepID=UPI001430DCBC